MGRGLFWRRRGQGDAVVLVNGLAFVVVFGMRLTIGTGNGLRRLIGFEAQVARLVLFGFFVVAEAVVAEHQIVMRLQILGVDGQCFFELGDGIGVALFKKEHAAQFVVNNTVAREL